MFYCLSSNEEIVAAFMAFLQHYDVLPDVPGIDTATKIAKLAPRQLIKAKALEDALCAGSGINRATWTFWGGRYGAAERGGPEREACDTIDTVEDIDAGGWHVSGE